MSEPVVNGYNTAREIQRQVIHIKEKTISQAAYVTETIVIETGPEADHNRIRVDSRSEISKVNCERKVLVSNFLAIYAGQTKAEADALLAELKSKYPKAIIKRMTANYEDMQ